MFNLKILIITIIVVIIVIIPKHVLGFTAWNLFNFKHFLSSIKCSDIFQQTPYEHLNKKLTSWYLKIILLLLTSVSIARGQRGVEEGLVLCLLTLALSLALPLCSSLWSLLGLWLHAGCRQASWGSWRWRVIPAKLGCFTWTENNSGKDKIEAEKLNPKFCFCWRANTN